MSLHLRTALPAALTLALLASPFASPAFAAGDQALPPIAQSQPGGLAVITADAHETLRDARDAVAVATDVSLRIAGSGLDIDAPRTVVDTSALRADITALADIEVTPALLLPEMTAEVAESTAQVTASTAALEKKLDAAEKKHAAELAKKEAAAKAAAKKAAEKKRAAAAAKKKAQTIAAGNTVSGAKATARAMASDRGWGSDQFSCLDSLWTRESGWNYQAYNADGGATGIPQALPGSKMASAGSDWKTNAATQIAWGLDYIDRAYGTPCGAWAHSEATNWY